MAPGVREPGDNRAGMLGLPRMQTHLGEWTCLESRFPGQQPCSGGYVLKRIFFTLGKEKFAFFKLNFMDTRGDPPDESFPSPCQEKFGQCLHRGTEQH